MSKDKMNTYVFEELCESLVRDSLKVIPNIIEDEVQEVLINFKELIYQTMELFGDEIEHTPYSNFLLEYIIGLHLVVVRQGRPGDYK